VSEAHLSPLRFPKSKIREFADSNRKKANRAERRFELILNELNRGVLRGRFRCQYPISGKWIVDFFFPENRLAVEIDGPYHSTDGQRAKDRLKENDCAQFDVTLIRFKNMEVFGDKDILIAKLRLGWRAALKRKNRLVGLPIGKLHGAGSGRT
jgi:very-short-patch-repair endonuclease